VQCVEHIRTCHAKSPMNTKVITVLPDWPEFNAATTVLRLLSQVPTDIRVFTKPSPLGKRHTIVKVPWPINYWIIDRDATVKVSPTHVRSVVFLLDVGNANSKSEIASQWLPTVASLTIVDPNQSEPLIKLPIYIRHDSSQYHTNVLIDSRTTLNFASLDFLTRNYHLGKCTRRPKIVVRIANEQRNSTSNFFSPTNVSLG